MVDIRSIALSLAILFLLVSCKKITSSEGEETEVDTATGTGDTGLQGACEGVTCNDPPDPYCQDDTTLVTFASVGECTESGDCTYAATLITCDDVCQQGQCDSSAEPDTDKNTDIDSTDIDGTDTVDSAGESDSDTNSDLDMDTVSDTDSDADSDADSDMESDSDTCKGEACLAPTDSDSVTDSGFETDTGTVGDTGSDTEQTTDMYDTEVVRVVAPDLTLPDITGVTYYIDPDKGDDDASGLTPEAAWRTAERIDGTGTVIAGDAVYVMRGTTLSVESLRIPSGALLGAYGTGDPPIIVGAVVMEGDSNFIDGLTFKATGARIAISILGNDNTVHDCEIDGSDGDCEIGIIITGEGNHIIGNYIHDITSSDHWEISSPAVFTVLASNNEIAYNTANNCWTYDAALGNESGPCLEVINGEGGTIIEHLQFHHNSCARTAGLFSAASGNFTSVEPIEENRGIIADSSIYYNLAVDAKWMYSLQPVNTEFENIVFENNSIIHTQRGKTLWTAGTGEDMMGIVYYQSGGYEVPADFDEDQVDIRSNIFVEPAGTSPIFTGDVSEHRDNLFAPAGVDLSTWSDTGADLIVDDPGLAPNFHLTKKSPAVDAASSTIYDSDLLLQPVPCGEASDIGAIEYCE